MTSSHRVISSVTCLGCGCTCDDIDVTVRAGRIADTGRACALGASWFTQDAVVRGVAMAGAERPLSDALDVIAALLRSATSPFIYLAPELSCAAQREAVALADLLHATIDTVTSATALDTVLVSQERGRIAATLGEVHHRADLVMFWATDPAESHPRLRERFVAPGATIAAVDVGDRKGPADASVRIILQENEEAAALAAVSGLLTATARPAQSHRSLWQRAERMADMVAAARYAVIVTQSDETEQHHPAPARASGLLAVAEALNRVTRGGLCTLRRGGNRSGADAVMTWQTGFPMAVTFARGAPEYRPYDAARYANAADSAIDAVLLLGAVARVPATLRHALLDMPAAVIGPAATTATGAGIRVAIDTGVAGIHEAGLAYRMDDVPVRLRSVLDGAPTPARLLTDLRRRCTV